MRIYFWDFCDVSNCIRQWIFFIITLLIFLFTLYTVINTYRFHKRIIFQLLPLSINCIATAILILLQLFQKGFQYHLATYLIQIYTYFLFSYTFSVNYIRVKYVSKLKKFKNLTQILFALFTIITIILLTFIFLKTISPSCQKVFADAYYIFFTFQILLYSITLYFGFKIYQEINNPQINLLDTQNQKPIDDHKLLNQDYYLVQRKRQIIFVLISYSATIILRILSIILNNLFSQKIHCIYIDQAYIKGSDSILGKSIIIINSVIELIPHILVPIAMYIIPSTNKSEILSSQTIIDTSDVIDRDSYQQIADEQNMRSRLSSLIKSNNKQEQIIN